MNFPFLALLAEVTELELMDGISLMVVGMGVVFFALITLWALLGLLGFRRAEAPKPAVAPQPAAPAPAPAASAAPASQDEITPEIYAMITAAVVAVAGRRARIQRVRFVRQADESWAIHGRQAIQASHRIRKG